MTKIEYKNIEGFPSDEVLTKLAALNQEIFSFGETAEHLSQALKERHKLLLCLALHEDQLVGFKLGFQERSYYFESWRGGVLPEYRGNGIAQALLQRQHAWCKEQGFRIVTTIAHNQNTPMLIVNLRGGFEIVGTFLDRRKMVKVMLQKWLVPIPDA